MRLVVVGAGYVGMALLEYLQNYSYELTITTTKKERVDVLKPFGKRVVLLDPSQKNPYQQLVDASDGMVVLVAPKATQSYEETYLQTAKHIFEALEGRKKPFYLLYTSSTSVCEGVQSEWVNEEMALDPLSEKGKILVETERLYLNSGVSACILRLGGIFGPGRELQERAKRFSGKEMSGTGNEPTNQVELSDIVRAIVYCIDHSLTGIYHVVNDHHPSRNELYSTLCGSMGIPGPRWNGELISSYKVSNQKIKNLGFNFS